MNVIVVLMDTLRRDYLGAYGNTWVRTPNLDAFARRSTQFMNSYMASYPCMPARQDLWTGRCNFFWRGWSPLEYTDRDVVRVMREQGRVTQMVTDHYHYWQWGGGNYHMNFDGVAMIRGQEGDNWITDSNIQVKYPAPPERLRAGFDLYYKNTAHFKSEADFFGPSVFRAATRWIENNREQESFFLMIDSFDPHEPWHTPDEYWRMYDPNYEGDHLIWPPYGTADRFTEKELHHIRACYAGEITLSDKYFGEFIDRLEELGMLENTMVIVTADHGYLFGEHNWVGKHSATLYNPIANTPLFMYHPDQAAPGRRVDHLVQMPDLYATMLDAVGAEPGEVHGNSLLPYILGTSDEPVREVACFGSHGDQLHVTDGEWVYVRRPQKAGPLYWYTSSHFFDATWPGTAKPYRYMDLEATKRRREQFDGQRFLVREDNPAFLPKPDELYHLPTDSGQARNRAAERPDVCERLRAAAARYMERIGVPDEQFERLGIERPGT